MLRLVLLSALVLSLVAALNVTNFDRLGARRSVQDTGNKARRTLVTAAKLKLQWTVTVKCSLLWEEISQLYNGLQAMYTTATTTPAIDPSAIPCRLTLAGQALAQTLLVIQCDTNDVSHGKALQTLLAQIPGGLGDVCPWNVTRDGVVKIKTTQAVSNLWHLDRSDQRSLPLNSGYTYQGVGTGVTIFSLDTGCKTTHPDFGGRATFGTNYADDDINDDCNGHGTHTASLAVGTTYGVAKNATIICLKCLGCDGSGSFSSVDLALLDIMDQQISSPFPAGVTMSLAGGYYQPVNDKVNELVNTYDVYVTVAAGNSGTNAINYSPASAAAALTVAASTITDALASYSNRGSIVDIAAPGSSIRGADYLSDGYVIMSGTSMSTPLVAGVVALMMEDDLINWSNFSGKSAMARVKSMATIAKIDDLTDAYGSLPLLFTSIGSTPVPQPPPPPPPPPAPPMPPPQSNEARPYSRPASNEGALFTTFLGHPVFTLFLFCVLL